MGEKKIRTGESWILIGKISIAEVLGWKCTMDLFGDTAAIWILLYQIAIMGWSGEGQIRVYKDP